MAVDRQRLGALLDGMIRMLAARQQRPMGQVMERLSGELGVKPDAVYKWRQGTFLPSDAAVERLVQIGVAEAGMDLAWAEEALTLASHPDRAAITARLVPPTTRSPASRTRHNLPHRPAAQVSGRDDERRRIVESLAPASRHYLVPLSGPGGIGKSALALDVAWRAVDGSIPEAAGHFDAVVWCSAKRRFLDAWGVAERLGPVLRGVDDLYATILDVVGEPVDGEPARLATLPRDRAERARAAERGLRKVGRALLIVDELDALDDQEQRRVLSFLRELPAPTKALVTTRFHEDLPYPLILGPLPPPVFEDIVAKEADARRVDLTASERTRIVEVADGNPLAAHWLLDQVAVHGRDVADAIRLDAPYLDDLYHYLFGYLFESAEPSSPEADLRRAVPPHLVLALLERASAGAAPREIAQAAGIDVAQCRRALNWLVWLRVASKVDPDRYTLRPQFTGYLERACAIHVVTPSEPPVRPARRLASGRAAAMLPARRIARSTPRSRLRDLIEQD